MPVYSPWHETLKPPAPNKHRGLSLTLVAALHLTLIYAIFIHQNLFTTPISSSRMRNETVIEISPTPAQESRSQRGDSAHLQNRHADSIRQPTTKPDQSEPQPTTPFNQTDSSESANAASSTASAAPGPADAADAQLSLDYQQQLFAHIQS